ncbi:MAG: COX15/CtaA family protein [Crocinitomicaceae bacterium]|nr:COX15/CtaA family protein [Crocinitomicaceae bacterium]
MNFSKAFVRFNWLTLVFIFLVVIAGSFVRITGSGMGCPDWPKCFGNWVPPTSADVLPENYKELYSEKRVKKVEKFASFLKKIGMPETADQLLNDPGLYLEQPFNARKTWTEYVNRLFGFLAGNAMLFTFIWILWKYRKRKLIVVTSVNLVLMGIQAWFGSIVVASNLVPWTITVHMLLALIIIGLQIYVLRMISTTQRTNLSNTTTMVWLIWICFGITFAQMFLGTQVREAIDELTIQGYGRVSWVEKLGLPFYIHRSFSWLVLLLLTFMAWKNERERKYASIRWLYALLVLELTSGVLLSYADLPGLVRTAHLVFATIIFGNLTMLLFRSRRFTQIIP